MLEDRFTLIPSQGGLGAAAPGLTLLEAFTRLMALTERDYMFFRTGAWTMHLVMLPQSAGEPAFESALSVDGQAHAAIMRQVCEHGLGLFRMIPDEEFHQERTRHDRAA